MIQRPLYFQKCQFHKSQGLLPSHDISLSFQDELKIDVFSNGKPPKLTPSVSLSSSKSFHNVVMEEVAPSDETIVESRSKVIVYSIVLASRASGHLLDTQFPKNYPSAHPNLLGSNFLKCHFQAYNWNFNLILFGLVRFVLHSIWHTKNHI